MPLWASEGDGGGAMFRERLGCDGEGTVEEVNRSSDCVLLDVGPALVVNDGVDRKVDILVLVDGPLYRSSKWLDG